MSISLPKRTIAVGLAIAVAFWLSGVALVAPALADHNTDHTIEQLLAQIASLQAQVLALQGGSGGAGCYAFTRDLTIGSTGADVTALQDYLTGTGHFTFSGGSTGYFGPITQAATGAWQAANGVAPTAGYFGPISRAKYNSVCTPVNGDGGADSGDLQGEEGAFKNFELLGDPSSETVYESDDQKVIGWKYEAQDSDLRTERVRIRFDATATSDNKPWKWLDEVCLWHGDDEVDCEDADTKADWSEAVTNIYEKTFSGIAEITREDDESEFFVAVKTPSSIDSVMDGDVVTVTLQIDSVRAEDAAGEDVTGPSSVLTETFTFDTDPSGKLELNIDTDKNDDRVVKADAINNTLDVVLLTWEQEVKEGPVTITDLAVDITSTNSATGDVGEQLASIDVYREGSKVKTKSIASTAVDSTVTFDNIDQTQDVGIEEWMIKGKVKKVDGTTFAEADGVQLNIDNADVTAEAANDDTVTVTGGTITGGQVVFYTEGIQVAFVDSSAVKTVDGAAGSTDDEGQFVIRFDVTAFGSDIYVPDGATSTTAVAGGNAGASYALTDGTVTSTESGTLDHDGTNGANSSFKVGKGNTKRFTMTTSVTATTGTTDFVKTVLDGVLWSTSDQATGTHLYNFNLNEFETPSITLVPR
jgi:hypothetical protein